MEHKLVDALIQAARDGTVNAYAPYSNFKVGAAVLAESGKVYTGCNVENASYGLTVCAERVAIQKAVSEGERRISAVAIVAGENGIGRPCGACLQVISEFAVSADIPIITASAGDGSHDIHSLGEYLPLPFEL